VSHTIPSELFKQGLSRLAGAVTIVAAGDGNRRMGLTATSVCSLSAEPPRVLACINLKGQTFATTSETRCVSISILSTEQMTVAMRFAGILGDEGSDPFETGDWKTGKTGAPVLKDAIASLDCTVDEMLVLQTHAVIICKIKHIEIGDTSLSPLLYLSGAFGRFALPESTEN